MKKGQPLQGSVIGLQCECLIVKLYDQGGRVVAVPVDENIRDLAARETMEYAFHTMKKKLSQS